MQCRASGHWITVPIAWLQTWRIPSAFIGRLPSSGPMQLTMMRDQHQRMTEWAEFIANGNEQASTPIMKYMLPPRLQGDGVGSLCKPSKIMYHRDLTGSQLVN